MSDTVSLGLDERLLEFPPGASLHPEAVPDFLPQLTGGERAAAGDAAPANAFSGQPSLISCLVEVLLLQHQMMELKAAQALSTGVLSDDLPPRFQSLINPDLGHNTDIWVAW